MRAVGPAIGGVIVAAGGPGAVFILNAVSFVGVLFVLYRWRRPQPRSQLPSEDVLGAIRAGLRYVRHAPELRSVLIRSGVFIFCGAALWALLPLVAKEDLGLGASGYGALLGCLGTGAVLCAAVLPKLQKRLTADLLIVGGIVTFAAATLALATIGNFVSVALALVAGGAAWMALMSTFNVSAQIAVPEWVRARSLALYLLVIQGGMAAGSVLWGFIAERAGLSGSLMIAAAGLVLGVAAVKRYPLRSDERWIFDPQCTGLIRKCPARLNRNTDRSS